ncbi:MAG: hypothetical protein JSU65_06945, partial [Candidatus Zixiibacteriota bacterium]
MTMRAMAIIVTLLAVIVVSTAASQDLTDPYEILNNHFRSMGGLDRLRAEQTLTFEGNISVAGLSGSIKVWVHKPDRSRAEVDLGILKIVQGDNGEYEWNVDSNGKLQKITEPDEAARKREQVTKLMTLYEYADPNSEVFSVIFRRLERVDTSECYVVDIGNNINRDVHTYYFDTDTYLLLKSQVFEGEDRRETLYYDYRDVEGLMVAFRHQETALQTGQVEVVEIAEYVSNPVIEPTVFDAP